LLAQFATAVNQDACCSLCGRRSNRVSGHEFASHYHLTDNFSRPKLWHDGCEANSAFTDFTERSEKRWVLSYPTAPTVGILYPGEMGSVLGRLLRQHGVRVVTTLQDRGARTQRLCREAGLEELASLQDVAEAADIVLSLVCPSAALSNAEEFCRFRTSRDRIFVDLNSVSPVTALQIRDVCVDHAVGFVDGAMHGLASQLPARGTMYLSGPEASRVAELFPGLRTRVLSETPGETSSFKMLISGVNKGVIALFVEVALAAERGNQLEPFLECCRESYPGILSIVERVLPTCPQHAARRAEEMGQAEQTLQHYGLAPHMMSAAHAVFAEMADAGLAEAFPDRGAAWSVMDVIKELHARQALSQPALSS